METRRFERGHILTGARHGCLTKATEGLFPKPQRNARNRTLPESGPTSSPHSDFPRRTFVSAAYGTVGAGPRARRPRRRVRLGSFVRAGGKSRRPAFAEIPRAPAKSERRCEIKRLPSGPGGTREPRHSRCGARPLSPATLTAFLRSSGCS